MTPRVTATALGTGLRVHARYILCTCSVRDLYNRNMPRVLMKAPHLLLDRSRCRRCWIEIHCVRGHSTFMFQKETTRAEPVGSRGKFLMDLS